MNDFEAKCIRIPEGVSSSIFMAAKLFDPAVDVYFIALFSIKLDVNVV